jgi:hypothetical protein
MMDLLIDFLPSLPLPINDGQASITMLGAADDDNEQRTDQRRGGGGGGDQPWMEERVEWNLRRPIARSMKEPLDHGSMIIDHSKQRDDASEQQCQGVETVAEETMVEVVEDDEWASRNAAYETCFSALGDRFVKRRGKSMLFLLIKDACHHRLAKRVIKARPELVLVPNHGARAKTALEVAAKQVELTSGFDLFRRILITLKRQVRERV